MPEGRDTHFEYVSLHRGLHHYRYQTGETLVQLDVPAFMNWLADKPGQIATPVKTPEPGEGQRAETEA